MSFLIGVEGSSHFTPSTLFSAVFHLMCSCWVHWNGMVISAPSLHLQADFSVDQLQRNMMLVGQRIQITSSHLFSCDIPHPHPSTFSVHKNRVHEFAFKNMVCFSNAPVLLFDSYRKCAVTVQYVFKVILTGSKKQIISENIWSLAHMHISCQARGSKWKQMQANFRKSRYKLFLNHEQHKKNTVSLKQKKVGRKDKTKDILAQCVSSYRWWYLFLLLENWEPAMVKG